MGRGNKEQMDRSEIRINRKMRMWHKYKVYFVTLTSLVGALLAVVIVLNIVKGVSHNIANNSTTAPTETQTFVEEITEPPTTEAPTLPAGMVALEGSVVKEEFVAQDFYENAVFLGDSVLLGIEHYGYLDKSHVFGDVNATSGKLESYVKKAVASKPNILFLMVGHNDANYGTIKEEKLAGNIADLVTAIGEASSDTKVYVLSITPVTTGFEGKSNVKQSYIDNANELLKNQAEEKGYIYVDIASAYKDDSGHLRSEATSNGINITNSYYPFILNGLATVAN